MPRTLPSRVSPFHWCFTRVSEMPLQLADSRFEKRPSPCISPSLEKQYSPMFQLIRNLSLNVQLGPFGTFEELQAAAAPGIVLIAAVPNATSGDYKSADGTVGRWTSPPFSLIHPASFTALTGPYDTFEELQAAVSRQIPGTVLVPAAKNAKNPHVGFANDSQGRPIGEWQETK